jgi:hypothetical protein
MFNVYLIKIVHVRQIFHASLNWNRDALQQIAFYFQINSLPSSAQLVNYSCHTRGFEPRAGNIALHDNGDGVTGQ